MLLYLIGVHLSDASLVEKGFSSKSRIIVHYSQTFIVHCGLLLDGTL